MKHTQEGFAERVGVNQQDLASKLRARFDYIVCGAVHLAVLWLPGLRPNLKTQVLLRGAGGTDETELIMNPNRWPKTLGSELD